MAKRPPKHRKPPETVSYARSTDAPEFTEADAGPVPLWPGLVVTAICAAVYLSVGGAYYGFDASGFTHHNLTANAWLNGRTHVTGEEIERQTFTRFLRRHGRTLQPDVSIDELRQGFRQLWTRHFSNQRDSRGRPVYSPAQVQAKVNDLARVKPFHDWVQIGGRYYAYWPPVPALIMLPFVAIWGPAVSDILVGNLLGVASVLCVYLMLRSLKPHWPGLSTGGCLAASLFYGLGTCAMYQACIGQVWYLTQLSGTLFLIIAAWFGIRAIERPAWLVPAGLMLGLGFLGRNTIILAAPMFALLLWMAVRESPHRHRRFLTWGAGFAAMLVLAIGVQLAFNEARFGDYREFGQGLLAGGHGNPRFDADFKTYGRFHPHFVARNAWYYFLNPRMGVLQGRTHPIAGGLTFDPDGNSLFLTSPLMAYMLLAWRRRGRPQGLPAWLGLVALLAFVGGQMLIARGYTVGKFRWADTNTVVWAECALIAIVLAAFLTKCVQSRDLLLWAVLAGAIPGTAMLMMFHGTGWYQFGQRYLLDALPLLLILTLFGMRGRASLISSALIAISIAVNAWGTYRFCLEQG